MMDELSQRQTEQIADDAFTEIMRRENELFAKEKMDNVMERVYRQFELGLVIDDATVLCEPERFFFSQREFSLLC